MNLLKTENNSDMWNESSKHIVVLNSQYLKKKGTKHSKKGYIKKNIININKWL